MTLDADPTAPTAPTFGYVQTWPTEQWQHLAADERQLQGLVRHGHAMAVVEAHAQGVRVSGAPTAWSVAVMHEQLALTIPDPAGGPDIEIPPMTAVRYETPILPAPVAGDGTTGRG